MKKDKSFLVLDQYRTNSEYNDFIGKFYHFPKKYLSYFPDPPIEFIYYEPQKKGKGEYFGCGTITKNPFPDKREDGFYFIEIDKYIPFQKPIIGQLEKPPYYNPRNAVRNIDEKLFEEICLEGNIRLNFTADAHLVDVLGEQLIGSEKVGILELVKNSYDANAENCKIYIEKIDSLPKINEKQYNFNQFNGPVIVIEDDGIGMSREIIENGWLRPASVIKTHIKEDIKNKRKEALENNKLGTYEELIHQLKKAHNNRIPLGEKGVGRFAVNRLGRKLLLKTKTKEKDYEYVLEIDWELFRMNSQEDLQNIGIILKKQLPSRDYGEKKSGTQLIIYEGKDDFTWDKEKIEDLNRAILQLNSPNNIDSKFNIEIVCPQLSDLSTSLLSDDFTPIITFTGLVDEKCNLDYELKFTPPKNVPMSEEKIVENGRDLKIGEINYWKKNEKYRLSECGDFIINVDVWYRDKPWIDGPNANKFLKYLDSFGGLSIYRDGINIFPAEKGKETDWLGLSRRQIKQVYRISYYHMIGNIEIDQTKNFKLTDKTNREGLIENQAYKDFKWLVRYVIEKFIEDIYTKKRDIYKSLTENIEKEPKVLNEYVKQSEKIVNNIKQKYPYKDDPYKLLTQFGNEGIREKKLINLERSLKNLQKSLNAIEESKALLTEQAGFGLAIAVSIHELAKITSNFYIGINEILKRGMDKKKLEELRESSLSLKSELNRLSPMRAIRNEKKIEFDILRAVNYSKNIFDRRLKENGISIEININNNFKLYARYGAVLQILSNLFTNSLYWLQTPDLKEKKIIIEAYEKNRCLYFADTGPGIHESIQPYLFQAGYSLKTPASGLGLYICKYYMQAMKGDIYSTLSRERLKNIPGAQFTLDFEKVKK